MAAGYNSAMSSTPQVCPECGAALAVGQEQCWLCHRSLVGAQTDVAANPYAPPRPTGEHLAAQFSLETLFLVMTLVAVCFGAFLLAPGLGVFVAIVAVPALARSFMVGYRYKQVGMRLTTNEKIGAFALSFLLVWEAGLLGCIAFIAVCTGTGLIGLSLGGEESVWITAPGMGAIAGLAVAGWLFWR